MNTIPRFRPVMQSAIERPARPAATRRAEPTPPASAPPVASPPRPAAVGDPAGITETQAILTAEERDFFAARAVLGSLSYRPRNGAAEALAPPTGQRIDVRG